MDLADSLRSVKSSSLRRSSRLLNSNNSEISSSQILVQPCKVNAPSLTSNPKSPIPNSSSDTSNCNKDFQSNSKIDNNLFRKKKRSSSSRNFLKTVVTSDLPITSSSQKASSNCNNQTKSFFSVCNKNKLKSKRLRQNSSEETSSASLFPSPPSCKRQRQEYSSTALLSESYIGNKIQKRKPSTNKSREKDSEPSALSSAVKTLNKDNLIKTDTTNKVTNFSNSNMKMSSDKKSQNSADDETSETVNTKCSKEEQLDVPQFADAKEIQEELGLLNKRKRSARKQKRISSSNSKPIDSSSVKLGTISSSSLADKPSQSLFKRSHEVKDFKNPTSVDHERFLNEDLSDDAGDDDEEEQDEVSDGDEVGSFIRDQLIQRRSLESMLSLHHMGGIGSALRETSNQFTQIFKDLKRKQQPMVQMAALQELAEILCVCTEDTFMSAGGPRNMGLNVEQFVETLLDFMRTDPVDIYETKIDSETVSPDAMLLSCRCIANLMEALPSSTPYIIQLGGIPLLVNKLKSVEYIDLAEQVMSLLEKLSGSYPTNLLKSDVLLAVLEYIDFFNLHVQRSAVHISSNITKVIERILPPITSESYEKSLKELVSSLKKALSTLQRLLSYSDPRVVEHSASAIAHIFDWASKKPESMKELVDDALIREFFKLLNPSHTGNSIPSSSIFVKITTVLSHVISAYPEYIRTMLSKLNLVDLLVRLLTSNTYDSNLTKEDMKKETFSLSIINTVTSRPHEHLVRLFNIASNVLPGLPNDNLFVFSSSNHLSSTKKNSETINVDMDETITVDSNKGVALDVTHLIPMVRLLLPIAIDCFSASVNLALRRSIIKFVVKSLWHVNTEHGNDYDAHHIVKLVSELLSFQNLFFDENCPLGGNDENNNDRNSPSTMQVTTDAAFSKETCPSRDTNALFFFMSGLLIVRIIILKEDDDIYMHLMREGILNEVGQASKSCQLFLTESSKISSQIQSVHQTEQTTSTSSSTALSAISNLLNARGDSEILERVLSNLVENDQSFQETDKSETATIESISHGNDLEQISIQRLFSQLASKYSSTGVRNISSLQNQVKLVTFIDDKKYPVHDCVTWSADSCSSILSCAENSPAIQTSHSNVLLRLSEIAQDLSRFPQTHNMELAKSTIETLSNLICSEEGVTAHEIVESNILSSLVQFLEFIRDSSQDEIIQHKCIELSGIFRVSMLKEHCGGDNAAKTFVNKLQSLLSRAEFCKIIHAIPHQTVGTSMRFVHSYFPWATSSSSQNTQSQPLLQLAKQLRLKLIPADPDSVSPSYKDGITVSIHAIASLKHLANFIKGRISFSSGNVNMATRRAMDGWMDVDGEAQSLDDIEDDFQNFDDDEDFDDFYDGEDEDELTNISDLLLINEEERRRSRSDSLQNPSPSSHSKNNQRNTSSESQQKSTEGLASNKSWANVASEDYDIVFYTEDANIIPNESTVFAIAFELMRNETAQFNPNVWEKTHVFKYAKKSKKKSDSSLATPTENVPNTRPHWLSNFTESSLIEDSKLMMTVLATIKIFYDVFAQENEIKASMDGTLDPSAFINRKISAKLNKQLDEPLIVTSRILPRWCEFIAKGYPFLLPFETRMTYLQSTSFGYSRSIHRWQHEQQTNMHSSSSHGELQEIIGRVQRHKVRIHRNKILPSMIKIMDTYGSSQAYLEIEFHDEVGSGLGPTLEFYSAVCKNLVVAKGVNTWSSSSNRLIQIWRSDENFSMTANSDSYLIAAKTGLFPLPLDRRNKKICKLISSLFENIGVFVAKALLDGRQLDLPLHPLFVEFLIYGMPHNEKFDRHRRFSLLESVDKFLHQSLSKLRESKHKGECIQDFCLSFTLPGRSQLPLKKGGKNIDVTNDNLEEYIDLVMDRTLYSGIQVQVNAFRQGFTKVFPISDLQVFTIPESVTLLGGAAEENWSFES